jgi:hypothetical protein
MLKVQQDRAWHGIITLDASWLSLSTDHEFVWIRHGEKVPERERHTIQSKKFILTIVWNPLGFHLIDVLGRGRKFNAPYYVTEILSLLSESCSTEAKGERSPLMVYVDNARPDTRERWSQFFEQNRMKAAPDPSDSPDIAPSDFSLFGYIKGYLGGLSFENADELLESVRGVLRMIEKVTLHAVFLEWMERLRKCIVTNGEYVESSKIKVRERWISLHFSLWDKMESDQNVVNSLNADHNVVKVGSL